MSNRISFYPISQYNTTNTEFLNSETSKPYSFDFSASKSYGDSFVMAKAFLAISEMTNKKLQKLCYYAKAWYLAIYDYNIVSDPFEAWVHGAVQPDLYHHYKKYGFSLIPKEVNTIAIPDEYISFANEIYDSYGHLTGDELEALNHSEMPWIKARNGYKPWENCNVVISENDMKEYYRKMM